LTNSRSGRAGALSTLRSAGAVPPGSEPAEGRSTSLPARWCSPDPFSTTGPFVFLRRFPISTERRVRVNRQIRISPVRVIGPDGEQLGILPVEEALAAAEQEGLDLVEVAPTARPPVVRIMDYGKFKYEEARQARAARKKQHQIQIKEVKMRPGIEPHDFEFKIRHARRFLQEGDKVKVTMMFRGRQITHPELGRQVLQDVAEALQDVGKVESQPSMEGRSMIMIVAPKK
jgi:translation initiation factor IF-3